MNEPSFRSRILMGAMALIVVAIASAEDLGYELAEEAAYDALDLAGDDAKGGMDARVQLALVAFAESTTAEILRSEEPCAIARMLMPARPSVPKKRAATPGVPAIPSPTTATILWSSVTSTRCI